MKGEHRTSHSCQGAAGAGSLGSRRSSRFYCKLRRRCHVLRWYWGTHETRQSRRDTELPHIPCWGNPSPQLRDSRSQGSGLRWRCYCYTTLPFQHWRWARSSLESNRCVSADRWWVAHSTRSLVSGERTVTLEAYLLSSIDNTRLKSW